MSRTKIMYCEERIAVLEEELSRLPSNSPKARSIQEEIDELIGELSRLRRQRSRGMRF